VDPPSPKQVDASDLQPLPGSDTYLAKACKAEADKHFKELMNVRAQLFQLCPDEPE
jgi:hypothetical protein